MTVQTPIFTLPELSDADRDTILDAVYFETRRFFGNVILWGLEHYEIGRQKGKHNEGRFFSQPKLETVAFGMLRDENEAVYDIMTEVNEKTNRYIGDEIFGSVLRELIEVDAVAYDRETGGVAFNMILD